MPKQKQKVRGGVATKVGRGGGIAEGVVVKPKLPPAQTALLGFKTFADLGFDVPGNTTGAKTYLEAIGYTARDIEKLRSSIRDTLEIKRRRASPEDGKKRR